MQQQHVRIIYKLCIGLSIWFSMAGVILNNVLLDHLKLWNFHMLVAQIISTPY